MTEEGGTALVTGASGFVGSHLVEALVAKGVTVRALLRSGSAERWLPTSPLLQVHRAEFGDHAALERAVDSVDTVYHLAAVTSAPSLGAYFRANLEGTQKLIAAISSAAPHAKLVHCSTLAASGPATAGRPRLESDEPRPLTPYGVSKLEAERAVLGSALQTVVLRPPTVYGPRDRDILEMFRWAARGVLPVVGRHEQQLSIIHVHDLVRALMQAASARSGSLYFVDDGIIHTRDELMRFIALAVGRKVRRIHIPVSVGLAMAHSSRLVASMAGWKPLLTPDRIRDFTQSHWTCDASLVRAELGFQSQHAIEEGMKSTAAWYREQGWI